METNGWFQREFINLYPESGDVMIEIVFREDPDGARPFEVKDEIVNFHTLKGIKLERLAGFDSINRQLSNVEFGVHTVKEAVNN